MRLIIFLLFISNMALGHSLDFGQVTEDILLEKVHPIETDAAAAILYSSGDVEVVYDQKKGFVARTTVTKRIKIYDAQKTQQYHEFIIPLYVGDSLVYEKVLSIVGVNSYLENGQALSYNLQADNIHSEQVGDHKRLVKLLFPSVKSGAVLDISYIVESPYLESIGQYEFQSNIPVDESYFSISFPEFYKYNVLTKGWIPLTKRDDIQVANIVVEGENEEELSQYSYRVFKHFYNLSDVPSLKEFPYVTNMANYRSAISYELSAIEKTNGESVIFAESWDEIASTLLEDPNFGGILDKEYPIRHLTLGISSTDESAKMKRIYDYVKTNYEWDGSITRHIEGGMEELLLTKRGNLTAINLLLVNLLKREGVDAYPVLTRKRSGGFLNSLHPSLAELNYTLAAVKGKDGNLVFLDATATHNTAGYLPTEAINNKAILLTENQGLLVDIMNPNYGSRITLADANVKSDGSLDLSIKINHSDYFACTSRAVYADQLSGSIEDSVLVSRADHNRVYNQCMLENFSASEEPLKEEQKLTLHGCSMMNEDEIVIDALLDYGMSQHPFSESERNCPIFFDHTYSEDIVISIVIPDEYTVAKLPSPLKISAAKNSTSFSYTAKHLQNRIQIRIQRGVSDERIHHSHYRDVQKFYSAIIAKSNERIILVRNEEAYSGR